jgi:hypothetical protein
MGDQWKFFDPAAMYLPFGMLRWQEEGMPALICDPKEANFVTTPISPAEKSLQKRTATFTLSEDGAIEGDARIEYTGQFGAIMKEQDDDVSPGKREENFRNRFKAQMSTAELSEIKIENVTDPDKPFVYSFHVRVPGYAQRTGKRLFIQPAFFQKGIGALFPASTRKLAIYFHYPWKEEDNIMIELPAGFALDNADRPEPFKTADVADYNVSIGVTAKGDALQYKRTFRFNAFLFPASSYAPLRQVFERIHQGDNHTITLKQAPAAQ